MNYQKRTKPIYVGDKIVVVGVGKSGLSAAIFCKHLGAIVTVSDSAPLEKLDQLKCQQLTAAGIEFEFGGHSLNLFASADLIIVSPGVPLNSSVLEKSREQGVPVIGEMSLAAHYLKTPMVAVTGTNGKTTVTTLLGDMFTASGKKVFVGGNIGTPLTDYLLGSQDADVVVLEVSSFQLDSAADFKPDAAILLNISPDHLDRYDSFEDYAESKFSIFRNQADGNVSILNIDDYQTNKLLEKDTSLKHGWVERSTLFFGKKLCQEKGAVLQDKKVKLVLDSSEMSDEIFDLSETELAVSPNLENGMAAILAAKAFGCESIGIRKALSDFKSLQHRLTQVAEIDGVEYLDDSKATNIGAVQAALVGQTKPVILIAGGRGKGGDYSSLQEIIFKKVKRLLLIGETRNEMADVFKDQTKVEMLDSLKQAVVKAYEVAVKGDVVILSPACASFDMFNSYSDRGSQFRKIVNELPG